MNTQFKSFIHLLRRYPMPILCNVLGLAMGMAIFIIISMETAYNSTYDHHIRAVERIYQCTNYRNADNDKFQYVWARPQCETIADASPVIESSTFRNFIMDGPIYVRINGVNIKTGIYNVASNYFDFFGFDWLACDTTTFTDPNARFLPESMAQRLFDSPDLIRKPLSPDEPGTYIGGIYRDFPENSSLTNVLYAYMGDENKRNWSNLNYSCYVRLFNADQRADAEKAIFNSMPEAVNRGDSIELIPYTELHFRQDIDEHNEAIAKVNPDTRYLLLFIALMVIIIACINFTNLYAALCPLRIRSINTQKVLGATRGRLFGSMLAETTLVCVISWVIALALVELAARMGMGELQHAAIDLTSHPLLVTGSLVLAMLMGAVSGVYPALYATSFQPALVLKGNFGLSPKGRSLRNLLIGIQFSTAFALFICVLNVWQQNDYMRHSELGYNQDRLININVNDACDNEGEIISFMNGLQQLAVVENAAFCDKRLSSTESDIMTWIMRINNTDQSVTFNCMPVSGEFLRTAGIPVIEGNDFPTDGGRYCYIFNEAARRKYDKLKVGVTIANEPVIGFCPDIKFGDIHKEVVPMAFHYWTDNCFFNYIVVRISEGVTMDNALQAIRDYARPLVPDRDIEVLSQFDVMDITYANDLKLFKSLLIFCVLAILICLSSVFGLVVFECEYRRKEIGVRKVMGAVTGGIIAMLCRKYAWILAVSFIIAAPVAWYAVDQWLQNFAYRTEILPWTFLVPLLTVAAVTFATVAIQSYRTANANPVDSLHAE